MPTAPLILAFDTSAACCAAALLRADSIIADRHEAMQRGQAERLMPMLQDLLADAGADWGDLDALGVGIGPGNFTGIRIAVSAARGLALGLNVPAVGVSGCEARSYLAAATAMVAIPAPRDQVYLCDPEDHRAVPRLMTLQSARTIARDRGMPLDAQIAPQGLAAAIARIAAGRWTTTTTAPAPLYVRPADAAPSRDLPPVLLD
jgi:tRNA threonylcarbamoyladenosine biosynthesis protein TsaB